MNRIVISGSLFSIILGLAGLSLAWNAAVQLWHVSPLFSETIAISTTVCLKLAQNGVNAANLISIPLFVAVNLFILWLTIRMLFWLLKSIPKSRITI
jgi:hypothetical protein